MRAKGLTMFKMLVVLAAVGVGGLTIAACGKDWEFGGDLDPYSDCTWDTADPLYHEYECIVRRCAVDAGLPEDNCNDAGSASGSSARCAGTCVPNKPDDFDPPQPVYIGPPLAQYVFGCPIVVGGKGAMRFADLRVPQPGCPSCVCGNAEGSCSIRPNSLVTRTDVCDQPGVATDFGGPLNWDGSCTNANAIPMGVECPPGSGILCAQAIDSTDMLEPVESCEPIPLPVPKFTSDYPWWEAMVLSCSPSTLEGKCEHVAAETCLPSVPADVAGWRYCVRHAGLKDCPTEGESPYHNRFVAYPKDAYTDTRACTKCNCTPKESSCSGTLRVYADDSCSTNEIVAAPISSDMTNCINLLQSGASMGSKEITDVVYAPGPCEPSGGEPIGEVLLHDDEAVTWCCLGPSAPDAGADAAFQ